MSAFKFDLPGAEVYVPDNAALDAALSRTTHLGVGAHADDLELMAYGPILECFGQEDKWFTGVTVTDGAGSLKGGSYAAHSDEQMAELRRLEQRKAAMIGAYAAQFQLNYPSSQAKDAQAGPLVEDLLRILKACSPHVVYTHNLADKHDTHVAVALKTVQAIRHLAKDRRPKRLIGCELWRGLDWLQDADKVAMEAGGRENLAEALLGVYDSQIASGKRYDLAALGRRRANATFFEGKEKDRSEGFSFGMDLTPLIEDDSLDPAELCKRYLVHLEAEVVQRLKKFQG